MIRRTTRFRQQAITISVLLALAAITGCGGDDRVGSVHGIVTLDGKPVGDAGVTFMPKAGGRPAFGITAADGTYELMTFKIGDGALIGNHSVTITAVDEQVSSKAEALSEELGSLAEVVQPNLRPRQVWRVPERYSDSDSSGLEFEVKRGEKNQADFSLKDKS